MRLFEELGTLIERRWRDQNYAEGVFPEIAARSLSESNLCDHVDPWEIVRWVHSASSLPDQMDLQAKFGNPPITLYAGPRSTSMRTFGSTARPPSTNTLSLARFKFCKAAVFMRAILLKCKERSVRSF